MRKLQGMTKFARFAPAKLTAKLVIEEMTERLAEEGKHFPPETMLRAMNKARQAAILTERDEGVLEAVDLHVVAGHLAARAASHFPTSGFTDIRRRRRRCPPLGRR